VFTVTGADTFGNPVAAAVAWSTSSGTVTPTSGSSAVFTPSAAGSATVTASAGTVAASATVTVTAATAHVSSIAYTRTSGILYATITTNVPNATLGVRILKNSVSYAAGTVTTGSNGTAVARVSAPSGCYAASITSFSAAGYGWDGVTPANGRCF
jgi:hypothetical protein